MKTIYTHAANRLLYYRSSLLLAGLLLLLAITSQAQISKQDRRDQIATMKIGFITKSINLTPDEAKSFWPVYNQYESELEAMRAARKKLRESAKEDFIGMNDAEIEKMVDGEIASKQSELDIQRKYHAMFKKVLPVKKVALLYRAEEAFKVELIRKLQETGKGNK